MRVALLAFGFGEYSAALATGLADLADVTLLLPREDADIHAGEVDHRARLIPFERPRLRRAAAGLRMSAEIARLLRSLRPDVVHLQAGYLWLTPFLGRLPGVLVVTVHDPRPHLGDRPSRRTPTALLYRAATRADAVIVHGEALRAEAVQAIGLDPRRVHVVPTHARGLRWITGAPRPGGAPPTVLFFGRIWPYKGLEYLIRAEPRITARVPGAEYVIAGEGEDLGRYRSMMAAPERFVIRNEFVSTQVRGELFRRASVVVLPYLEATQSGVVSVAYAHARPVVASRVGAIPELVQDGRTGLLVPPGDIESLADAVARILERPDWGRALGEAGRDHLFRHHSPEVAARATVEVYRRALAERAGGAR
jgi:glycosyltransferase involved in cell wall biosynthesis